MTDPFGMLARFVIRPHSKERPGGDVLVGAISKTSNGGALKPGTIYQIVEILGTLQIVEVGPAAIKTDRKESKTYANWSFRIDQVITSGTDWLLTEKEAAESTTEPNYD